MPCGGPKKSPRTSSIEQIIFLFEVFGLDFSCKLSKLQYNSLAFVAGFKSATDEGSLPEISSSCFTAYKGSNLYILFNCPSTRNGLSLRMSTRAYVPPRLSIFRTILR